MATKMGYAPGTRIQLQDNSAYTVVENPNTVAGIVGYASKGELNKIIPVANTGELGVKLGYGYQSYKYNQGMYAANAVLTTGGEVEFVRPYGEEISRTDAYKRDLKTDAFVVAYDKNASLYANNGAKDKKTDELLPETSFKVKHYASTRFKTDGAAEFGVTRKINNIAETVESGSNVQFNVDASETFSESKESRSYDNEHCTDMVMFAIMNRDPSYASRAYDRYEVVACSDKQPIDDSTISITCTLSTKPLFGVGDTVFVPNTSLKTNQYGIKGKSAMATEATVTSIDDKKVTLSFDAEYGVNEPDVIIYNDPDNAVADGFDYLNIRTAVAGNSVKNFASIKFGVKDKKPSEVIKNGTILTFRDKNNNEFDIRLQQPSNSPFVKDDKTPIIFNCTVDGNNLILTTNDNDSMYHFDNYVLPGDALNIDDDTITIKAVVQYVLSNEIRCLYTPDSDVEVSASVIVDFDNSEGMSKDFSDVYYTSVSGIETWYGITEAIANTMQYAKKFSRVAVTNDIISVDNNTILMDPSATYDYAIGDIVAIVRNSNEMMFSSDAVKSAYDKKQTYTITAINPMGGIITVDATSAIELIDGIKYQLINLTSTNATVYNIDSVLAEPSDELIYKSGSITGIIKEAISEEGTSNTKYRYKIPKEYLDDEIHIPYRDDDGVITVYLDMGQKATGNSTSLIYDTLDLVSEELIDGKEYYVSNPVDNADLGHPRQILYKYWIPSPSNADVSDMYLASSYTLYVSKPDQKIATFGEKSTTDKIETDIEFINVDACVFNKEVEKSPVVLADSDIGASFLSLGLANTSYVDVNFDGNPMQVFTLTDDGIEVARMFMAIQYRFNGKLYEFEGTVAPFNYNNRQLSIADAAEYELSDSGLEFVINESGVLDYFLENSSYDLSQTVKDGVLNGSYTAISYNEDDPAIMNDAVWTYDPKNNNSGSTLSTVWTLFMNKDASDVDMLVSAGVAINSPFTKKYESLNTQVMQAMIDVCESRKDCFCVFDGVYEPDIQKAVKKMIIAGQVSMGRWGALYDGRGVFQDSLYTNSQVDCMKSIQLAAIITANRQSGIFWIPPAGDEAFVPSAWGTKERFTRTYSAEDKNCDHAKLNDIHVNATRVNRDGMRIWGDFTLQMRDTAFNQIHVTMLVAGIHKMFYKYLDHKVFKLNTTVLRAQITSDLQSQLNSIKRQNPAGLIDGKVICDDTNNTPELIDQNFLIVDLKLLPPKSTRWIILRTTVESQKNGKNITTEILTV